MNNSHLSRAFKLFAFAYLCVTLSCHTYDDKKCNGHNVDPEGCPHVYVEHKVHSSSDHKKNGAWADDSAEKQRPLVNHISSKSKKQDIVKMTINALEDVLCSDNLLYRFLI